MALKIVYKKTEELVPYANNPRNNDEAVEKVANSIKQFGFNVPIVVDENNVIVCGHTRLRAAQALKLPEVPCVRITDLTPEQIKAYRLVDNKTSELSSWDFEKLDDELSELVGVIDMGDFGFLPDAEEPPSDDDGRYTSTINVPTYEPIKETPPPVSDLIDTQKYDELLAQINAAKLPDDVAKFLRMAATRHIVFDYKNIAEFYAHADANTQDLMEKSALVIIDYDKAIEYGYAKIKSEIDELREAMDENDE